MLWSHLKVLVNGERDLRQTSKSTKCFLCRWGGGRERETLLGGMVNVRPNYKRWQQINSNWPGTSMVKLNLIGPNERLNVKWTKVIGGEHCNWMPEDPSGVWSRWNTQSRWSCLKTKNTTKTVETACYMWKVASGNTCLVRCSESVPKETKCQT